MGNKKVYPDQIIASRIQQVFRERNLKDNEVAEATGYERRSILKYRTGLRNPPVDFIRYMCVAYDVNPVWLLNLENGGNMITADELEWRDRFAKRLKKAIVDSGMMYKEVAEEAGIAASSIPAYVAGSKTPSFYVVMMLSEALDVKLTEFI